MATIVVPPTFSPGADAAVLHNATKGILGLGTDETAIIKVLGRRTSDQIQKIRHAYQELYQEDLVKRLESALSGKLERAVYRWIHEPADRDAIIANYALTRETDYHVIIELSCILTPDELLAVKRAYQNRYKHSLEEDLASHTTGDLRQLLVGLVSAHRYHGDEIDASLAKTEAKTFLHHVEKKDFNDAEIIRIITTRSKAQVTGTLNVFKDDQGSAITKHLGDKKCADEYLKALRNAVKCITDPKKYYEKLLRNALKGFGADEEALTRAIVTRAEKDLRDIKDLYYKTNSVTLEDAIAGETCGHYEEFLLTLLGKEI